MLPLKQFSIFFTFLLFSLNSVQASLPSFSANFDVSVYGITVGEAKHRLTCHNPVCELSSEAKPPRWAKRFINEETEESSQLSFSNNRIQLLKYTKKLTRHLEDETQIKTTILQRDNGSFKLINSDKQWQAKPLAFDIISLPYALQFLVKNQRSLDQLYLQDDKGASKINFTRTHVSDEIDLPYEDEISVKRFEFSNDKISAKIWLLPQTNYFPARIEVFNKEQDRTIVLELNQQPY